MGMGRALSTTDGKCNGRCRDHTAHWAALEAAAGLAARERKKLGPKYAFDDPSDFRKQEWRAYEQALNEDKYDREPSRARVAHHMALNRHTHASTRKRLGIQGWPPEPPDRATVLFGVTGGRARLQALLSVTRAA